MRKTSEKFNLEELEFRKLVDAIDEKWGHTYQSWPQIEDILPHPDQKAWKLEGLENTLGKIK